MSGNLVLTRKVGQKLMIGTEVVVEVAGISGDKVRLRIIAPLSVLILRDELAGKLSKQSPDNPMAS